MLRREVGGRLRASADVVAVVAGVVMVVPAMPAAEADVLAVTTPERMTGK